MICSKNLNSGFTFVEVMLALVMLGTLLAAALGLGQNTLVFVNDYSSRLARILLLKETLFDITFAKLQKKPFKKKETQREDLPTKLSFRELPISQQSSLKEFKDHISLYQVKAEWNTLSGTLQETMVALFVKENKKKS